MAVRAARYPRNGMAICNVLYCIVAHAWHVAAAHGKCTTPLQAHASFKRNICCGTQLEGVHFTSMQGRHLSCCLCAAAAGLPVAFGTSHVALQDRANLQPGQTVLVLGAAGGVGIAAVQVPC